MPGAETDYDIIVVGGGINGAGIARDAALRGMRVLLLEKNDFGGGTSSWSTSGRATLRCSGSASR